MFLFSAVLKKDINKRSELKSDGFLFRWLEELNIAFYVHFGTEEYGAVDKCFLFHYLYPNYVPVCGAIAHVNC